MYEYISGKLVEVAPTYAVVEAAGVGYYINISLQTFSAIENADNALLYVHFVVREDVQQFYGFATKFERELFRRLISVSGVGGNTARMILSTYSPSELKNIIATENAVLLKNVKGLGLKTAQKIIVELSGKMLELGVDKDAIYNAVFNQYSVDRMKLVGYCLYQKMRVFPENHAALIYLGRKELYRFNFQKGDAEGIVNMPMQSKDIHYSVFMREDKATPDEMAKNGGIKTKIKLSFRSQGDRPVNVFASEVFNGGGHANAAGGEYYGPLAEAVQLFLDNYQKYFTK